MNIPELETPRLRLIALNESHAAHLFNIFSDEESMKYWDGFPHKDVDRTKKMLALFAKRMEEKTGICWGITLKETPQDVVGLVTYNHYEKGGNAYIGYIIARKHWNKGLTTEALTVFVEFGFTNLNAHRIEARVKPGNVGSEKVLQKIGFHREGLLRERVYHRGDYQDMIHYGLLKTDERNT